MEISFICFILSLEICSIIISYKFQKGFSSHKPDLGLVIILSLIISSITGVFILGSYELFKINQIDNLYLIGSLSVINFLFYILVPLILLFYIENEREKETIETDEEEEALIKRTPKTNNSIYYTLKHYFYYLLAFTMLNLLYLILHKIQTNNAHKNLIRYSIIPDVIRKVSHFANDYESLTYMNFNIIILIGKLLSIAIVPYGLSSVTASLISNIKKGNEKNTEYNRLNTNFSKNFEIIKNITSKKLSGKPLTKKEKTILKDCKETQTILEHKQEILEEKYSTLQVIIYYITFPFAFFYILLSILLALLIIFIQVILLYNELNNSICGIECAYLSTNKVKLSFEKLFHRQEYNSIVHFIYFVYLIIGLYRGLKKHGLLSNIFRYKELEIDNIKSNRVMNTLAFIVFFSISLVIILQVFSLTPYYSFFFKYNFQCDVLNIERCGISYYGLVYMKGLINFNFFKIVDIVYNSVFVVLLGFFIIYSPIKAIWKKDDMIEKEKEIV